MIAHTFTPRTWAERYRTLHPVTLPAHGSPSGREAYYCELLGLYQELVAELCRVQLTPRDLLAHPHLVNVMLALDRALPPRPAGDVPDADAVTVALVPLRELTDLARAGLAMRRAQRAFFKARKDRPFGSVDAELRAARQSEEKFDAMALGAVNRERQSLPGMDGGDLE